MPAHRTISCQPSVRLTGALLLLGALAVAADPPAEQSFAGRTYQLTFNDEFEHPTTIDLNDTGAPGFHWYRRQFFGGKPTPGGANITVANGILTLGGRGQPGGWLNTAAPAPGKEGWTGQVFRHGGYFEARLRFDPHAQPTATSPNAWPAFWSMAIEHMALKGADQWPGQPAGYTHFIEPDFFEYDTRWLPDNTAYGGAVHDWYGIYNHPEPGFKQVANCGGASRTRFENFVIKVPAGNDFAQWHTFGCLWVPAMAGTEGYLQFTFDGQNTTDRVSWAGSPQDPPPREPWQFSILDQQGLVLLLAAGENWPIEVDWVRVWQTPPRR